MKRSLSESDSEDSEILDVDDSRALITEDGEVSARKKRRGMIEKRRRDRINNCLSELRLLVPAAVEKQGSAKLEKAEILQLTVEYLRKLKQATEMAGGLPADSAAQYRAAGFQQCMAEVTRYLTASEANESPTTSSPLKSQLLQHINWYANQAPVSPPTVQTSQPSSNSNQRQNPGLPVHSSKSGLTPDCLPSPQEATEHNNILDAGQKQEETKLDCSYSPGVLCTPTLNVPPRFPMLTLNPPNFFPVARGDVNFQVPFPGQLTELPLALLAASSTNPVTPCFPPWATRLFSSSTSSIAF